MPFARKENSRAPSHILKISFTSQKEASSKKARRDGLEEHKPKELNRREHHKNHKQKYLNSKIIK